MFILVLLVILPLATGQYNEDPCRSANGYCLYTWQACPGSSFQSGLCPTQPSNVKCCTTAPYQETACQNIGGVCKEKSACSGTTVSGKCPTQPAGVLCCTSENPLTSGCASVARSQWGARPPKDTPTLIGDDLTYVFVHHAGVGTRCYNEATCKSKVKGFQDFHMHSNGGNDIGYSFLIGDDGNVYEGRGLNVQGAHTSGFNTEGYGVCFIGNFEDEAPSADAVMAFNNLVQCLVSEGKIRSDYVLKGHRQAKQTACPGTKLFEAIKSWPHWEDGNLF